MGTIRGPREWRLEAGVCVHIAGERVDGVNGLFLGARVKMVVMWKNGKSGDKTVNGAVGGRHLDG